MSDKLYVRDLALELTRRCNMACEMCLRGKAETVDMPEGIFTNVFRRLSGIDCLIFTGGEPSLAWPSIKTALSVVKQYEIPVRQVYIVTNGLYVTPGFLDACREWHRYCLSCELGHDGEVSEKKLTRILKYYAETDPESERYGCYVALSSDRYHSKIPLDNVLDLLTLPHLVTDKCQKNDENWIICEGNAELNGLGNSRDWPYGPNAGQPDLERTDDEALETEMLYVSATGSLLKYCDYSYESQEDFAFGRVSAGPDGAEWLNDLVRTWEADTGNV